MLPEESSEATWRPGGRHGHYKSAGQVPSPPRFARAQAPLQHFILLLLLQLPSNQVPSSLPVEAGPESAFVASGRQLRSSGGAAHLRHGVRITAASHPLSLALVGANQQQQHPDAPKLIPLSALDRYQEGAELKLFCAASAPPSSGRIHFEWRKNHAELLASPASASAASAGAAGHEAQLALTRGRHLHISMMDESSSLLRISNLEADDSGNYTCLARNQHGFDSSTVRVDVNVRLKWIREPPGELQVRAGKSVQLECDASGQPAPLISWTSLRDHQSVHSKVLRLDRVQVNDSGLYECRASRPHTGYQVEQHNQMHLGQQQNVAAGEQVLRKVVKLIVNGQVNAANVARGRLACAPLAGRQSPASAVTSSGWEARTWLDSSIRAPANLWSSENFHTPGQSRRSKDTNGARIRLPRLSVLRIMANVM